MTVGNAIIHELLIVIVFPGFITVCRAAAATYATTSFSFWLAIFFGSA
jgi:hypothetical protein